MSNALERWLGNKRSSPFRELSKWEDSFDRLVNDMISLKMDHGSSLAFVPSCEISEDEQAYLLKFDLPGVRRDQVKVEVNQDQLTVRAERREENKTEGKKKFLSEVSYGSYLRTFTLPGAVDEGKVDAKFENGVLTVKVPKTQVPQGKQIPIQ